MYVVPYAFQCPVCLYAPQQFVPRHMGNLPQPWPDAGTSMIPAFNTSHSEDRGKQPLVFDIHAATEANQTYRTAVWTGEHLQVTLMSIQPGDDIGLEIHPQDDQFLQIVEGHGVVQMGNSADHLTFQQEAGPGFAILIPAGTWHNVTNIGREPMKLYSIYAPPHHPFGTVHRTKADAH